jgi:DNA-directed RNA polymerase specialized sigma24 family protein
MSSYGSITVWIEQLKAGDPQAAARLWNKYIRRLMGLARKKLRGRHFADADEKDVALSAFASFCRAAEHGQFSRLDDRDDLWQLLVLLTERKAYRLLAYERCERHGGRAIHQGSAGLSEVIDREPTPQFAAQVAEEVCRLLDCLGSAELRAVAVAKMEGQRNADIAAQLGVHMRTVERRLAIIRELWKAAEKPSKSSRR